MIATVELLSSAISDLRHPTAWLNDALVGTPTVAGMAVNEATALTVSAIFACVRNLAEDEAKLPLPVYEVQADGSRLKRKDHPLYTVLNSTANQWMTAFNARQAITASAALYGRGYGELIRNDRNDVIGLKPIHPALIRIVRPETDDPEQHLFEIRKPNGTVDKTLWAEDVFELVGFSFNGILGEMIAKVGKESIGLCIAADRFASSFFGGGTNPGGVITHPARILTKEQRGNIRQGISEQHKGPTKGNRLLLLWDGMTYTPAMIDPNKAQSVEARQFNVEDAARWFRMPPDKIGHLLRTKGWNTQEIANIAYLTDTLLAWFVRWEQEVKRKCFRPEDTDLYVEHLVDALLRTDAKTRATVHQIEFRNGKLSIDEWARQENTKPIGGELGKARWVMANMIPAAKALEGESETKGGEGGDENRFSSASDAMRPVFEAAISSLLRKESIAAKRADKKYAGDEQAFGEWLDGFYATHRDHVVEAITVPVKALAEMAGRIGFGIAEAYATEHVGISYNELCSAFASGEVLATCDRWCDRRHKWATRYLVNEVCHAEHTEPIN